MSFPESKVARAEEKETGRLEAFSDGVFAFAITLLALDLRVPILAAGADSRALASALAHQWPSYLAFVSSFFTVLIMWVNHHAVFKLVRRASPRVLFANGLLLMFTITVPFTTQLVSQYFSTPAAKAACAAYGFDFVLISIAFNLLWRAVRVPAVLRSDAPRAVIEKINKNYAVGTPLYLLATVGAFASIYITIGIVTALWVFWSVTVREDRTGFE